MILPLVNPFQPPYEVYETREATLDEMIAKGDPCEVKVRMIAAIGDGTTAARHLAAKGIDNGLGNHIQTALSASPAYKAWLKAMPAATPKGIARYQKDLQAADFSVVAEEIDQYGVLLSPGQCLFHGGLWTGDSCMVTTRPLSSSLCPQVALRNAEFNAKAYEADRIDLFVIRATNPTTKVFVLKRKGTKLGHESEVLFASGARLQLRSQSLVRSDYPAAKYDQPKKEIPFYVLEVDVS